MARSLSRDIVVGADPASVFDVLADPTQHPLFDGSGTVRGRVSGPPRLYLGARFRMRMLLGLPYLVSNQVVEFEEDRRIAWRHIGRHVWRYELEPTGDGGTRVTETFDWGPSLAPWALEALRVPERNARSVEDTLQRLKVLVEGRRATPPG